MKSRQQHTTAFYLETLLLIVAFVAVILVLTRMFGAARRESTEARQLTDAVLLAQEAAEAVSASDNIEEVAALLSADQTAAVRDGSVFAVSDNGYETEVSWEPETEGTGTLVSSTITVRRAAASEPLYVLDTSVFLQEVQP